MTTPRGIPIAAALGALLGLGLPAARLAAQADVRLTAGDVTDDRYSEGMMRGGLKVRVKPVGDGMDGVAAARVLVATATDDLGTSLLPEEAKVPDFQSTDVNSGQLDVDLKSPARKAVTVDLSGTLELFAPGRDPSAVVRVDDALSRPDRPLSSKGLKAARLEVTLLSTKKYAEERKKQRIDDAKEAEIRAEGKKRGMDEKEIDALIGLAKAFQEMGGEVPENAVILSGKLADMERIHSVKLVGPDGAEVHVGMSSSSSDGTAKTTVLQPSTDPPKGTALVFTLLTPKSLVKVPFDLAGVPLP